MSSLDTLGPVDLEDPGAGAASPGAALLGTPMPAPRITKSCSEPPVSLFGWGSAPSTSTLAATSNAPSTLDISCTDASHSFDVGSFNTGDSCSATTDRGKPRGTMARSPTLAADDATRGRHGDVTGCTIGG
jgi:hypothetical protein